MVGPVINGPYLRAVTSSLQVFGVPEKRCCVPTITVRSLGISPAFPLSGPAHFERRVPTQNISVSGDHFSNGPDPNTHLARHHIIVYPHHHITSG